MLRPSVVLGGPKFDVRLRGSDHWLQEAWSTLFLPVVTEAAPALLAIVDRHFRRAHQVLTASGSAGSGWDPVSSRRSAIEPHAQDQSGDAFDVMIDAARDCLEAVLDRDDDLGAGYLDMWAGTPH